MTIVNKFLIGLCLIAFGLFGIVFFNAFGYSRTPSAGYIDFNTETGTPITFVLDEFNLGDPCQDKVRVEIIGNGYALNSEWFYRPFSPNPTYTFYNLPAGSYTAQWVFYMTNNYHCAGVVVPDPADSFIITGTISIDYPADNQTYETEPNHFSISWSLPSSYYSASYQYKYFQIRYGTSENNLIYTSAREINNIATGGYQDYIPKITNLNGQGFAQATVLFCYPNFQGTCDRPLYSDIITWNAPTLASVSGGTPTDFGVIGNAIRDVALWAFIPDSASFNQFGGLLDIVKEKPPIGYFTQIKESFTSLASGSATITWDLTAIEGITTPLKTGIAWLAWILWAVWLLTRITKFDWHI